MTGRGRLRENQVEISLFPFLAVLICTMGMLVMLFVLMSDSSGDKQTAKLQNEKDPTNRTEEDQRSEQEKKIALSLKEPSKRIPSAPKDSDTKDHDIKDHNVNESEPKDFQRYRVQFKNFSLDQLREETESSDWFLHELRTLKKKTDDALTKERDRLASVEKAISDRIREIEELKTAIRLLHEKTPENTSSDSLKKKIADKETELDLLSKEIVQLQNDQKKAGPVYSIIPYQGKSGTKRYPIYIECSKNGVFLMPEGIPFLPEDFLLGKYPGNPFDTGLRAARECIMNKMKRDGLEREPYPLLIVRPGGEQAYYAAVYALSSWGGEFGYELVNEDWELSYPSADPQAEFQIRQQVQLARAQMAVPLAALLAQAKQKGMTNALKHGSGGGIGSSSKDSWSSEDAELAAIQNQLGTGVRFAPARGSGEDPDNNGVSRKSNGSGNIPLGSETAFGIGGTAGNGTNPGRNSSSSLNEAPSGALVNSLSGNFSGSNQIGASGSIIASDNPLIWGGTTNSGGSFNEAVTLPAYSGAFSEKLKNGNSSNDPGTNGAISGDNNTVSLGETNAGMLAANNLSRGNSTADNMKSSGGTASNSTTGNMLITGGPMMSGTSTTMMTPSVSGTQTVSGISSVSSAPNLGTVSAAEAVEGSATAGKPVDSSKELLSRIQQTGASSSESVGTSSQQINGNGWEQVGNTTYAQSGSGTSTTGSSASQSLMGEGAGIPGPQMNIDKGKKKEEEDKNPGYASSQSHIPGKAINLNEEIRKPVNASVERPILIECRSDSIVFPRQPGMRKVQSISTMDTTAAGFAGVNKELMNSAVLCIKSWGAAGRNMYWVPWIKVKVAPGGERNYENIRRIFSAQGITVKSEKTE